jgi:DNA-directed RNA polymerase specialized sigma subunit
MDIKNYLKQIKILKRAIIIKEARYKDYEEKSLNVSSPIYGEKIGNNPNINYDAPFMYWIKMKDETEKELIELRNKLKTIESNIRAKINQIKDDELKFILEKHYLDGSTLEEISYRLIVSKSTIKRLHKKALGMLN